MDTWRFGDMWPRVATLQYLQPSIERVQPLADISRSALCCHSNETHAPIASPPNSAQLVGTPTIPPSYIRVRAVVWGCGRGHTHRHTHTDGQWPLYISPRIRLTQNVHIKTGYMNIIICHFSSFIFWNNKAQVIVQNRLLFVILLQWRIKLNLYRNNLRWETKANIKMFAFLTKPTNIYEYYNLPHIHKYLCILRSKATNTQSMPPRW